MSKVRCPNLLGQAFENIGNKICCLAEPSKTQEIPCFARLSRLKHNEYQASSAVPMLGIDFIIFPSKSLRCLGCTYA